MSNLNSSKNNDLALLLLRVGVGAVFILAGWGKLNGIEGVQGFFAGQGIPLAGVMAWVVAIVEFAGGLMILAGYKMKIPNLLLCIIMLVAIFTVLIPGDWNGLRLEVVLFLVNAALYFTGSGSYSLDSKLSGGASED